MENGVIKICVIGKWIFIGERKVYDDYVVLNNAIEIRLPVNNSVTLGQIAKNGLSADVWQDFVDNVVYEKSKEDFTILCNSEKGKRLVTDDLRAWASGIKIKD